jgi:hypothetical protein
MRLINRHIPAPARIAVVALALLLGAAPAAAEFQLLTGFEGPVHEPGFNRSQTWVGLQYQLDQPLVWRLAPYVKIMGDTRDSGQFLVSTGLLLRWHPSRRLPQLFVCIQTGPAYTDVGRPHTGTRFNWSSDLKIGYKALFAGWSHTSNGGLDKPNAGLDILLLGLRFPWN